MKEEGVRVWRLTIRTAADLAGRPRHVENHCCTSCGVPQLVASDLVGWIDEGMSHSYWQKQPETHEEMRQALAILTFRNSDAIGTRNTTLRFRSELAVRTVTMLPQTFEPGHLKRLAICNSSYLLKQDGLDDCGPHFGAIKGLRGRTWRSVADAASPAHASSPARVPGHRRVVHLDFASGVRPRSRAPVAF
jgi:hypothetical protein